MKIFFIILVLLISVSVTVQVSHQFHQKDSEDDNAVSFFLYTHWNINYAQQIGPIGASIAESHFRRAFPTVFVIHGRRQGLTSKMNSKIARALLSSSHYNIIIVDWQEMSVLDYALAAAAVPKVGDKVGKFINHLSRYHGLFLSRLTIVGFDLGAHVAGFAGKTVGSGEIGSIIALDAALLLFNVYPPHKRLDSSDARYVEAIHTNAGGEGFLVPIGHADFYPNGGIIQPGCPTTKCNHNRSIDYYVEALKYNNFGSITCKDYIAATINACGNTLSSVRMGNIANSMRNKGIYYVPVKKEPPYGTISAIFNSF
ncbi:lipase member H-A-like [Scaptodrosophila lebanonensis]|uniref:Lipase member H-A-like n=1 Tax=Drosophila lebanonensis TaxID=7225 RepID=A0A6J2TJW9_DROLE|nr:lipase member H-A-like [Scaptodrosophila lebanonensis]